MRLLRTLTVAALSAALILAGGPPATGRPDAPGGGSSPHSPPGAPPSVTLITGDVVHLSTLPDGRPAATMDSRDAGPRRGYRTYLRDGEVYVIPVEALAYLASGQLDEALFNVTGLVDAGYHDRATDTLPLLLTAPAGPPPAPAGATRSAVLPSIGAVAVTVRKSQARQLWAALTGAGGPGAAAGPAGRPRLAGGVGAVWLDRPVRASLADSVPQVGAPAAWAAGYDGSGVTVAVLDTGVDADHPDLAGRVVGSADFTGEGDPGDRHGHGTHVAATVAGRGTAGRVGVAPGADLLAGKVLDQTGSGTLTQVITGMQWAVDQGADVVNLSLGSLPSDGTDPLSLAVDQLTAESGTLFVAAAGNGGPEPGTVETPGAASAALTVGAVSKQDRIAGFSARGPRIGDGAPKPELVAPGVGIVAARAAGTSLGELIDDRYTALSGTSMAAPHVAGAAALLAQQHPEWRAPELKAALVGSAHPVADSPPGGGGAGSAGSADSGGGAGRLDAAAAVRQPVLAQPAAVGLGRIAGTPGTEPVTAAVSYQNAAREPVTLELTAEATAPGTPPRPAALTVTPARLTIPPGGQASAALRLDPAASPDGTYTGVLSAAGPAGTVRTPLGFIVDGPRHQLTVTAVDRNGGPPGEFSSVELWNLDTGALQRIPLAGLPGGPGGGQATVPVPAGRYALMAFIRTADARGRPREATLLGDPELVVTGDRTVHLDTRQANELRLDTPQQAEPENVTLAWQRTLGAQSILSGFVFPGEITQRYSAGPTEPPTAGRFDFFAGFELAEPKLAVRVPGPDGFRLPTPGWVTGTPLLDGRHRLRLVDGGAGTPAELADPAVPGAAVLVRFVDHDRVVAQLRAAADAGARLVLLRPDTPGHLGTSVVPDVPVPSYTVEYAAAERLRGRLAGGGPPVRIHATGVPESPYRYQVLLPHSGRIPADLRYDARRLPLATVESTFHDPGAGSRVLAADTWVGAPPTALAAFQALRPFRPPLVRTDYLSTGAAGDVIWRHDAAANSEFVSRPLGSMFGTPRRYPPGAREEQTWFPALVRPAVPEVGTESALAAGTPVNRAHDAIRVGIPPYANGAADQYGWLDRASDRARLTLRREGDLVGETDQPTGQFTVPGEPADYQLTMLVTRDGGDAARWWATSTATTTRWSFRSGRPASGQPEVLPLLQVGYQLETDQQNAVPARQPPSRLVLSPGYQPGATGRGPITVRLQVSYDAGARWHAVPVRRGPHGTVVAILPRTPAGAEYAWLRLSASDRDGNRLDQLIERAWRVAPVGTDGPVRPDQRSAPPADA